MRTFYRPRVTSQWMTILVLIGAQTAAAGQGAKTSRAGGGGDGYRIAGTVVSKTDGHPLSNARVTVSDTKNPQKIESAVTADDGKYEFNGLPAGKYSLSGRKRGFISAAYDEHEQFSTAIVTGSGLDTEHLALKLAPDAVLTGKVLDETGEAVRHAQVTVYYDDHSQGISQIHPYRNAQSDDLGVYEITPLRPGTYFLSVRAKPWYAVHHFSEAANPEAKGSADPDQAVDRSLDVAYPLTYYPDVTETDDAQPILIQGGERVQMDIHLNPVPALRTKFRVPGDGSGGFPSLQLEQSAFDGATTAEVDGMIMLSPGVWEMTGIPAGRYNIRTQGTEGGGQMNGVDLTKDGEEVDASKAESLSSVKVQVEVPGESAMAKELVVGLRSGSRPLASWQPVNAKGEAELQNIPAGSYELVVWSNRKRYSIAQVAAEGAEVTGHVVTLTPGASSSVSLMLVAGNVDVQGIAKKSGKGFAGAMVVLVPDDAKGNRNRFRRDQSDLDGTFSLAGVIPGSYTVLAIQNGWDLDWSQPEVVAPYVKRGRKIEVGSKGSQTLKLPLPVEVQAK